MNGVTLHELENLDAYSSLLDVYRSDIAEGTAKLERLDEKPTKLEARGSGTQDNLKGK